jgi:hypothetical protein
MRLSFSQTPGFFWFFWRARVCWPLLCLFRPFLVFEGCLDSTAAASRRTTNLASHPSPYLSQPPPPPPLSYPSPLLSHPSPLLSHPSHYLSNPSPLLSQPSPYLSHPSPLLSHPSPYLSHPSPLLSHPFPYLATHPITLLIRTGFHYRQRKFKNSA